MNDAMDPNNSVIKRLWCIVNKCWSYAEEAKDNSNWFSHETAQSDTFYVYHYFKK